VRQVRAGHDIQITDRGEVVAELLPPYRRMPRRLKPTELQRLLDEERGERSTSGRGLGPDARPFPW